MLRAGGHRPCPAHPSAPRPCRRTDITGRPAGLSGATVDAARADAEHWFDPVEAAAAGRQRFVHETAARVLAPYRDTGRPHRVPLRRGDETVLFWGDIVHNHAVQLRLPYVSTAAVTDEDAAVVARRSILQLTSSNRWWVGAAHLPFPGLGHVRRDPDRYTWVPITYAPVEESSTHSRCVDQRCAPSAQASLVGQSCRVRR
jgi:hypothetical protein